MEGIRTDDRLREGTRPQKFGKFSVVAAAMCKMLKMEGGDQRQRHRGLYVFTRDAVKI